MRSPRVLDSLTELSLAYTAPTDAVFPEVLLRGPLAQLCPALRRLDLGGLMLHAYGAAPYLCARLGAIAPYLTHLKLSTKMALAGLVGVASTITQPPQTQHLLPTVTRVLIALEHHSTDTTCGGRPLPYNPPYASPPGPCECWRCLLLVTAAADERFVVVEGQGSFSAPVRWEWVLERCEVAWMDRVSGGEGSWDESKAVVK
ncbi:hypothetical protein FIBSPDRAFT_880274 [Athelia psychrophila]|uniref:Uncharacterized protein n=1 Tax=Athelia psychrophila TaxID=1759441 RepID=A0A167T3B5_9AGAM|nr:hypothetical protein FIBSPDRAFT_880274 [Fibularhizoctonia sp. CBS 109695]